MCIGLRGIIRPNVRQGHVRRRGGQEIIPARQRDGLPYVRQIPPIDDLEQVPSAVVGLDQDAARLRLTKHICQLLAEIVGVDTHASQNICRSLHFLHLSCSRAGFVGARTVPSHSIHSSQGFHDTAIAHPNNAESRGVAHPARAISDGNALSPLIIVFSRSKMNAGLADFERWQEATRLEEEMRERNQDTNDVIPRRSFFSRIAAMSVLGLSGFATAAARAEAGDGPEWPGTLKGRHKQVFDVYDINEGSPLNFANNFITPNESATAVLIFRHKGLPFALSSAMWEKYKIGESFKINDPETKAHTRSRTPGSSRSPACCRMPTPPSIV
jgi:hypothetical protein